jgi:hypothetical protein
VDVARLHEVQDPLEVSDDQDAKVAAALTEDRVDTFGNDP